MTTSHTLHPVRLDISAIDPTLYEFIKIPASQINGCAHCLDMHLREARELGQDQRRLDVLSHGARR